MSAKRSFDIGPTRKEAPSKPRRRRRTTRTTAPRAAAAAKAKNLRQRREEARQRTEFVGFLLVLIILVVLLYGLWRPEARIGVISVSGTPEGEAIEAIAREKLKGTYYLALPRDSFFWYPEPEIRDAISAAYPRIAKVKISRSSFSSISIDTEERVRAFLWCGTPSTEGTCYEADEKGFVFAEALATGTPMLRVRAELDLASSTDGTPLRGQVVGSALMPKILRFVDVIEAMGTPVTRISIREDEADLYVESGTRITYVIGYEDAAARDARASFPNVNLMDGSIAYVDLRFPGKIYLKRNHEE